MFKGWIDGLSNTISALWGNNTTVSPLPPNQNIVETEISEDFIEISVPTGDLTREERRAQEQLARRAARAAQQQERAAQRALEREQRALQREAQKQQRAEQKARRTLPQTPMHVWQETPTDPEMATLEADFAAYVHENDISLSPQQVQAGEELLDTDAWLNELSAEDRAIVQGAQEEADKINRVAERAAMPMFGQTWTEEELLAELDAFSLSEEPEALEQKSVTSKPVEPRQPKKRKLPPTPAGW